jgi:hypothetical protein
LIKIFLITLIFIALAFAGLALNILVKKNGRFPSYKVGHNRDMKRMGITCVKHDEIKCYRKLKDTACESCSPAEPLSD